MRLLIIEDDVNILNCLKKELMQNGLCIDVANNGIEGEEKAFVNDYDLILLDLMLPGLTGEEILAKVNAIPIIVLSAKISSDDKVNCLLSGANDYITKPFDSKELLARIEVQLRNHKNEGRKNLKYKDLELLSDHHTLLVCNHKVNLTKTEYAILKQLLLNPTQVIPKNKLLDLISFDTEDCSEFSLKVHISNLRKKIRRYTEDEYIESIWGIGFKMSE